MYSSKKQWIIDFFDKNNYCEYKKKMVNIVWTHITCLCMLIVFLVWYVVVKTNLQTDQIQLRQTQNIITNKIEVLTMWQRYGQLCPSKKPPI